MFLAVVEIIISVASVGSIPTELSLNAKTMKAHKCNRKAGSVWISKTKPNLTLPLRKSFVEMCLVQIAKHYNYASISSQESLINFKYEKAEPTCGVTYITKKGKTSYWSHPWAPHMCFSACNKTFSFSPAALRLFERLPGFVSYCRGQQALTISATNDDLRCNWTPKSNRKITVSPSYATYFLKKCSALLQNCVTFEELFPLLPIKRSYVTSSNTKEMKIPAFPLRCRPTTEQTCQHRTKSTNPYQWFCLWICLHHGWQATTSEV